MSENILKEAQDVPDVMNAKLFVNYMSEKIPGKYFARTHEQMLTLRDIGASAKANGRLAASDNRAKCGASRGRVRRDS
jgi:hypothetical protein